MASPPSSIPSPVPSTSSSHHPQSFSSFAMPPPANIKRAPSTASGISVASGRESKASGFLSNGNARPADLGLDANHDGSQSTPQPQHNPAAQYSLANQMPFLPPVTSSPPPHVPPYVPPPQHAMPPDPIHTMMNQQGVTSPGGMVSPGSGWPNGPSGWRGSQPQPGFPGPPQQFNRQMPNGHQPSAGASGQLPSNPLETYNGRMSMPPLSMNGRPGSRQGDSRDRRRDREGREEKDLDDEVITTIFVVGFPDDMLEREFQNIFTFTPGFEAATLKFPSGANRPREPAAALLAELQALAANQGGDFGELGIPAPLEEALAALQLSTASSSSTTPSAAISMTPSAPTGPVLGGPGYASQSTRRQTIGFARFKTRADALAAREHLQGRKIDSLTGATLKAEMAKKNLHTKRTTSGEELVGLLLRSGRLAGLMGAGGNVSGGGLPILPNGTGSGPYGNQQFQPPLYPPPNSAIPNAQSHGPVQPQSAKEAWDSWPHSQQSSQPSSHESRSEERLAQQGQFNSQYRPYPSSHSSGPNGSGALHAASDLSNTSGSPPTSITSPNTRPTDSKALLALAEEADEMEGWSVAGMGMAFDGYTPRRSNHTQPQPIVHGSTYPGAYGQQQIGAGGNGRDLFGSSPPGESDHMSDAGRSMGLVSGNNPADQNPPINTLYVGNLPAVSPPTLPPNYLEESLRSLFQSCPGYKRMSFRQKINGPMCFVEFEDVNFASNAIQHLYGHNLNNLVKGGIRLSYSKNSLGQRGASHPAGHGGPGSGFGGMPHNVGMAGLASPGQSYNQVPGPAYGLQLNGHQQSAPPGPSTAPLYNPSQGGMSHSAPVAVGQASTSLSPTAQPFALPSTSPRSRYFGAPPNGGPAPVPVPVPTSRSDPNASFQAFQSTAAQLSPVGSPIRTPGSFSWVSSGSGVNGAGGYSGFTLGSLDGAASAWGTSGNNTQSS